MSLGLTHKRLLQLLLARCDLASCKPQELANLAWAVAKAEHDVPDGWVEEVLEVSLEFMVAAAAAGEPQPVAAAGEGAAAAGDKRQLQESRHQHQQKQQQQQRGSLQQQECLGNQQQDQQQQQCRDVARAISRSGFSTTSPLAFKPAELAMLGWALASLQQQCIFSSAPPLRKKCTVVSAQWKQTYLRAMLQLQPHMQVADVAMGFWAVAVLGWPVDILQQQQQQQQQGVQQPQQEHGRSQPQQHGQEEEVRVAQEPLHSILQRLLACACELVPYAEARHVAMLLWSLARLQEQQQQQQQRMASTNSISTGGLTWLHALGGTGAKASQQEQQQQVQLQFPCCTLRQVVGWDAFTSSCYARLSSLLQHKGLPGALQHATVVLISCAKLRLTPPAWLLQQLLAAVQQELAVLPERTAGRRGDGEGRGGTEKGRSLRTDQQQQQRQQMQVQKQHVEAGRMNDEAVQKEQPQADDKRQVKQQQQTGQDGYMELEPVLQGTVDELPPISRQLRQTPHSHPSHSPHPDPPHPSMQQQQVQCNQSEQRQQKRQQQQQPLPDQYPKQHKGMQKQPLPDQSAKQQQQQQPLPDQSAKQQQQQQQPLPDQSAKQQEGQQKLQQQQQLQQKEEKKKKGELLETQPKQQLQGAEHELVGASTSRRKGQGRRQREQCKEQQQLLLSQLQPWQQQLYLRQLQENKGTIQQQRMDWKQRQQQEEVLAQQLFPGMVSSNSSSGWRDVVKTIEEQQQQLEQQQQQQVVLQNVSLLLFALVKIGYVPSQGQLQVLVAATGGALAGARGRQVSLLVWGLGKVQQLLEQQQQLRQQQQQTQQQQRQWRQHQQNQQQQQSEQWVGARGGSLMQQQGHGLATVGLLPRGYLTLLKAATVANLSNYSAQDCSKLLLGMARLQRQQQQQQRQQQELALQVQDWHGRQHQGQQQQQQQHIGVGGQGQSLGFGWVRRVVRQLLYRVEDEVRPSQCLANAVYALHMLMPAAIGDLGDMAGTTSGDGHGAEVDVPGAAANAAGMKGGGQEVVWEAAAAGLFATTSSSSSSSSSGDRGSSSDSGSSSSGSSSYRLKWQAAMGPLVQQLQVASQQHLRECLPRELVQLLVGFAGLGYYPGDAWMQLHGSCCGAYLLAATKEGVGEELGDAKEVQRGRQGGGVVGFSSWEKQALRKAFGELRYMRRARGGYRPEFEEERQLGRGVRDCGEGGSLAVRGAGCQGATPAASLITVHC